tara:strand:+ start:224 stop:475 length:252 start_codon:yes stop_codon:yes gene_type:complete
MDPELLEMMETNTGFEWTPIPNTEPQRYLTRIDDEGMLTIPENILKENGWEEGDVLEFIDNYNGSFSIRKQNDSTIKQEIDSD